MFGDRAVAEINMKDSHWCSHSLHKGIQRAVCRQFEEQGIMKLLDYRNHSEEWQWLPEPRFECVTPSLLLRKVAQTELTFCYMSLVVQTRNLGKTNVFSSRARPGSELSVVSQISKCHSRHHYMSPLTVWQLSTKEACIDGTWT